MDYVELLAVDEIRPAGACPGRAVSAIGWAKEAFAVQHEILEQCQQIIGYRFKDIEFLSQALTHASRANTRLESNERLEFLGDAVLGLTVCDELYRRYSDFHEGDMTKIKSSVVSRQTCAIMADEMGISRMLFLGKGMPARDKLPTSVSAAVFEAIIGAIYMDGGLAPASRFILEHVAPHIDQVMADEHQRNYKSLLQQYAQRRCGVAPEYKLLDEKGPDHSKCFEVVAVIKDRHFPSAWGKNKKQAEQEAARLALEILGLLETPSDAENGDD